MANNIVVSDSTKADSYTNTGETQVVSWVMSRVELWEEHRNSNYQSKWEEYWRLWRAIWSAEDKTRESERSKLISPALMQAIEATVAELDEATFGKGPVWFDLDDDVADDQKESFIATRNQLLEDFDEAKVPDEISKIFLYGAIFGTGIGKILVEEVFQKKMVAKAVQGILQTREEPAVEKIAKVITRLEAVHPQNFVIDSGATSIEDALGCAHITLKPTHSIVAKQLAGIYNNEQLVSDYSNSEDIFNNQESTDIDGVVKIVEYHGKVPRALLEDYQIEIEIENLFPEDENEGAEVYIDETDLVEAIVTIANDSILLRAIENPALMQDRGFVAYQHDLIPNSFWGRGVAEKGYNPQKALDADLRARIDALALIVHPMMAADSTRLIKGQKLTVSPGRTLLTNGDPSTVFMPFKFGNLDPNSFAQSGDLERMIQVGTGAIDSAAPTSMNARNNTSSGMSMMSAGAMKRQKRAKHNIDRQFLNVFIKKSLWRNMQYNPERYPIGDYTFSVKSSMGLMAREYEQNSLTQLLSITPPDSPAYPIILKGILSNSSLETKGDLLEALEQAKQPSPEQQQMQQMAQQKAMLEMQNIQLENEKLKSEIARNYAQAGTTAPKLQTEMFNAETNRITAMTNASKGSQNGN